MFVLFFSFNMAEVPFSEQQQKIRENFACFEMKTEILELRSK